jgi:putative Mn2+ efflux pump MntP
MRELYERVSQAYFAVATWFLIFIAVTLFLGGVWEVAAALFHADILGVLDSVGLIIIGFAIIETSKFIAEEELLRQKELRSAVESRRSLTKFITIIVIAASLEALVMIFETSRTDVSRAIYPAALFATAMFALVALGLFQWLSSRIAPAPDGKDGASGKKEPEAVE